MILEPQRKARIEVSRIPFGALVASVGLVWGVTLLVLMRIR